MNVKAFEVRDDRTFIPVAAIRMQPFCWASRNNLPPAVRSQFTREEYLLRRAGFAFDDPLVILCRMEQLTGLDGNATCDPHSWRLCGRTLFVAHCHIQEHWDDLKSGDVIDVEFILGETKAPKVSEGVNE